jgi:peptidoglycan hydrolase-like protein with peptidoglycan-binding domain
MRLTARAREAMRPAIWALAALLVLLMAPAAAAETPPAGSEGGARRIDQPAGWSAGPVALGTGFHSSEASSRVREVQRKLNRLGYASGPVDGLFGPRTDAAVRRFQTDSGLAVDGAVGPRTLRQLLSRIAQKERLLARGSGFRSADGSERVRDVQRRLNRLGHGAGAVDGLFGPTTDAAVRRFQGERALVVDGVVGPRTLAALGSAAEPIRERARTEDRGAERQGRTPSARARSDDPAARRRAPAPDFERAPEGDPLQTPLPTTAPDQTDGPRWGFLLLIAATLGLVLAVVLLFRADRSAHEDDDPLEALGAVLSGVPYAGPLLGVGARADLASAPEFGAVTGTAYVELQLFAESERGRCETDPLDGGAPFSVEVERLEEDVRAIVVPERLPALARALRNAGRDVQPAELERLPFMLELSPELEGELVRRTAPTGGLGSRRARPGSPSAKRRPGSPSKGGRQ